MTGSPQAKVSGINGINFNWGLGQPVVNGQTINVGPDTFSVRFTSTQVFLQGTYQFTVTADDGVRILIDGQMVYDRFQVSSVPVTKTFLYNMIPGAHLLKVEYFEGVGNASIQVKWSQVE